MNLKIEYKFRTKTGICVITPDRLELTREGIIGEAAEQIFGKSVARALAIYSLLGIVALAVGIWFIVNSSYFGGGFFCVVGILLFWNVISSWNNSAANIIERSAITSVSVRTPHPPFTRGYFVVHFLHDGKKRKRLIILPGSMSGGKEEFKRALSVMQQAKLI